MVEVPVIDARFELVERAGGGSWGEVFRARDRASGELVAVKKLRADLRDEVAIERFRREVRLLASVESHHVVRYVAHGADGQGTPCLVVEWLAGEDLAQRQRRAPLSGSEVLDVTRQIALGLAALHDASIVHRDVKPSNVFLVERTGEAPLAKLIDLGVARVNAESTLTDEGVAIGTPYYMSPEQARGEDAIGPRSDLFSLGVVLFELCAGQRPFRGDDVFAVLAKIVLQEPPRLSDAVPAIPREIDAIVARAMKKSPDDRFATALEMARAIAAAPAFSRSAEAPPDDDLPTVERTMGLSGTLEQRVVTGVFAKLPPFPEEARSKVVFKEIAARTGGKAYALLGRNVVAVFGGDETRGDEVARAARAALAMAAELPGARVAVVTGRAVAEAAGLTGDVIERGATTLERVAIGAIAVDSATARLLGDAFEVVEREDGTRRLVGPRAASASSPPQAPASPRTLLGRATPCVGRDRELAWLEALFSECQRESVARAALVTGPAGAGKSRIRHELLGRLGDAPALLLFGRADSLGGASAFSLVGNAIRKVAGAHEGEPDASARGKIAALVGRRLSRDARDEVVDRIGEIAGLTAAVADPVLAGDRIRAAWEAWLEAESQHGPVVIVLEDLHAGDLPSVRLVDAALLALAERPLFVVALARREISQRFPDLWAERDVQRIPLPALPRRAAERLVHAALGSRVDAATVARVVERADGNPFFLEELIRAVAEEGEDAPLPDTVLGIVQARLDALGPDAKRLLRAASVFGAAFWRGGVIAVLGGTRHTGEVEDQLTELSRNEVLTRRTEARFPGEDEFVFRHALVCEAAYASLTDDDRVLAHRIAGQWLERAGERDALVLAEHHGRGGDPLLALGHYLVAARQALRGGDFDEAIARASRVSREGGQLAGSALLVESEANRWKGNVARAADCAVAAAELLEPATAAWFQAVRETIHANGRLGRIDVVEAWARESCDARAVEGAQWAQLSTLTPAAVHLTYAGRDQLADALAARVEALFGAGVDVDPIIAARVHQMRAMRAGHRGDVETELSEHLAALEAFERAGDRRNACLSRVNVAFVEGRLGEYPRAETMLREAHATAERMRLGTIGPGALHNLGHVLAQQGRLDEAREAEQRAVDVFALQKDPRIESSARVYLARILSRLGHFAEAEQQARAALERGLPGARAGALAVLSAGLIAAGHIAEGLKAAEDSAELVARHGSEEFDALARLALVEAREAAGDAAGARAALGELVEVLGSRAAALRDPARRERFLWSVPEHARALELASAWGVGREEPAS